MDKVRELETCQTLASDKLCPDSIVELELKQTLLQETVPVLQVVNNFCVDLPSASFSLLTLET